MFQEVGCDSGDDIEEFAKTLNQKESACTVIEVLEFFIEIIGNGFIIWIWCWFNWDMVHRVVTLSEYFVWLQLRFSASISGLLLMVQPSSLKIEECISRSKNAVVRSYKCLTKSFKRSWYSESSSRLATNSQSLLQSFINCSVFSLLEVARVVKSGFPWTRLEAVRLKLSLTLDWIYAISSFQVKLTTASLFNSIAFDIFTWSSANAKSS